MRDHSLRRSTRKGVSGKSVNDAPPPGCFLILSWLSGGRGRWEGEQPSPVSFSKLLSHHELSLFRSHAEPFSSIQARLKKIEYRERVEYFWSVVSESEIIYSFITHRVKYFKLLFLVILTTYGFRIMKTLKRKPNQVLRA